MKHSIVAALITAVLAWTGAADAQLSLPPLPFPLTGSSCSCVSDPPTEAATGQTALSVTTGGGSGNYTPNASYIANLNSTLTSSGGVAKFATDYPGWQALSLDSSDLAATITSDTMATYASAEADAQSQMSQLEAESFSGIEQLSSSAQAVLFEMQVNAEIGLAILNELRLTRQLLADLILVETTHHAEELNERARRAATMQSFLLDASGQPE
jgi:hypothetical protein